MTLDITTGASGTNFSSDDSQWAQQENMNSREQLESRTSGNGAIRVTGGAGIPASLRLYLARPSPCASRLLAGLLFLAGLSASSLGAQPTAAKAPPPPDRCLLVVEMSKAMQRRSEGVLTAVRGLLMSGLNGQLPDGSTVGLWTYNADLYARFDVQTWSSSTREEVTQRALTFLKGEKYEKQADFHKVAPALSRVIKDSKVIRVVLISSGNHEVRGTPFDDQINAAYRRWSYKQEQARMPFLTEFCAQNGTIVDYVVNTPPWPLEMPRLPEDTKRAEAVQAKLMDALRNSQSTNVSPRVTNLPPLIVSGKKSSPAPKPELATATPEAAPPLVGTASTNEPAAVKPPDKTLLPTEPDSAASVPAASAKLPAEPSPKLTPSPNEPTESKAGEAKAPETKAAESASVKPQPATSAPTPESALKPVTVEPTKPAVTPEISTKTAPATALTNGVAPTAALTDTATQPANSSSTSPTSPPSALPAPGAQAAVATPAASLARGRTIAIGLILSAALVGVFMLRRRLRAKSGPSLITRSLDRQKKP